MSGYMEDAAGETGAIVPPSGRGIVLYDFLLCRGGAENVTLSLARGIQDSEICVAFRNRADFGDPELADVTCHELARPPILNLRGWRSIIGLNAFRRRAAFIAKYDWAVFSGSNAPAAVRHRPGGGNIYYCHTVPRLAYDLHDWYADRMPRWQRPAFRTLAGYVRRRYEGALAQMDRVVANSANVQARLQDHLGIASEVLHPPCDTTGYAWCGDGEYYVSTARLEPYKRVGVIVEAFRRMPDRQLVVASGGSDEPRLRRLAAGCDNIRFTGWLSTAEMRELVGGALATVYIPTDEDFGMSPVESMAAGKPVIGVAEGGVRETVVDGETGILVSPDSDAETLAAAVVRLSPADARAMRLACERRAAAFGRERFLNRMREIIDSTVAQRSGVA